MPAISLFVWASSRQIRRIRKPHVTLCHAELPELVRRLLACERTERLNSYHVPEEGGRRE